MVERLSNWPRLTCVLLTIGCLLPFVNKAVHIDDPLFIWAGQWIVEHPTDFYGAKVNWYGTEERMAEVNNNPPLAGYLLALFGSLFGWGEVALHLGFMLAPVAITVGILSLAKAYCRKPL